MMEAEQTAVQPDTPMKRCTKCGEEKPATAEYFHKNKTRKDGLISQCKLCKTAVNDAYRAAHPEEMKARNATYRATYPEKAKASAAKYYAANKEKTLARIAAHRAKNKDKERERSAAYRVAHKSQEQAQHAAYYVANKDRIRARHAEYAAAHLDELLAKLHRRKAAMRNLPATFTPADWERSLEYFGHCCAVCGRPRGLWHTLARDHWIPLSRGGAYTPDNIVPLCHGEDGCNNSKLNRDAHEWLVSKFGPRKAARIERRIAEYFDWVKAAAASVA